MLEPWPFLSSQTQQSCRIFDLQKEQYRSPRTAKVHEFYILDSHDWVNVIPLTADDEVILVKQYRFGTKEFSLEIPGGMLDPDDSPAGAACRELLEETGYVGQEAILLGTVHPNPAIHTNRCYTYLVQNVRYQKMPKQDSTEDIEVLRVPLADIPELIRKGSITHALVIAAFYWYFFEKAGFKGPRVRGAEGSRENG